MAEHTTENDTFVDSVKERVDRYSDHASAEAASPGDTSPDTAGKKKGRWSKFTERLSKTHCTMTPPECR